MYIGELTTRQLISISLMILFTMAIMFFIGYKFAYDKAVRHANEQLEDLTSELEIRYDFRANPDRMLGNLPPLIIEGMENEK